MPSSNEMFLPLGMKWSRVFDREGRVAKSLSRAKVRERGEICCQPKWWYHELCVFIFFLLSRHWALGLCFGSENASAETVSCICSSPEKANHLISLFPWRHEGWHEKGREIWTCSHTPILENASDPLPIVYPSIIFLIYPPFVGIIIFIRKSLTQMLDVYVPLYFTVGSDIFGIYFIIVHIFRWNINNTVIISHNAQFQNKM